MQPYSIVFRACKQCGKSFVYRPTQRQIEQNWGWLCSRRCFSAWRCLPETVEARFWSCVDKNASNGCWLWTGTLDSSGYGRFAGNKQKHSAHRFSYEIAIGPIPKALTLDHLCRVRACVNPTHLEPVTNRENVLRGIGLSAANARKTHCPKGHPYSGENLLVCVTPRGTQARKCRTCSNELKVQRRRAKGTNQLIA